MTSPAVKLEPMQELDFYRGWLILLSQPYGRRYAEHEEEEKIQAALYKKHLLRFSKEAWAYAVEEWVTKEKKWPVLPELVALCSYYEKRHSPAPHIGGADGPPGQDEGEPYRSILMDWVSGGMARPYKDFALERITAYLTTHPDDAMAIQFRDRMIADGATAPEPRRGGSVTPTASAKIMEHLEKKEDA